MRGGNGYENNERRYLAYRVCYLILHQGYLATHERICLPDCMTQAIKREWPNPPGEKYRGFVRRRRRRVPAAIPAIPLNHHPRPIKIEKEVIEIEDEE